MPAESVLTMHDVSNIWRVPLLMQSQGAHATICKRLGLAGVAERLDMHSWKTAIADRRACSLGPCSGLLGSRNGPCDRPRGVSAHSTPAGRYFPRECPRKRMTRQSPSAAPTV